MSVTIHHGDSREVLKTLADASIDSVVCDPPYALVSIGKRLGKPGAAPIQHGKDGAYARAAKGFMGKTWDTGETAFAVEFWAEVYRVLKPGGHVVAFSGTRTYHRITCAIEDAGFEIRDMLSWLYGSGFPKSHDVSKGIDRAGGVSPKGQSALLRVSREAARLTRAEVAAAVGCTEASVRDWEDGRARTKGGAVEWVTASEEYRAKLADLLSYTADQRELIGLATDRRDDGTVIGLGHSGEQRRGGVSTLAAQWIGWGTALKPACEPIVLARKPLGGTVAANVLEHGTGALNIDGCRVGDDGGARRGPDYAPVRGAENSVLGSGLDLADAAPRVPGLGRWPANVVLSIPEHEYQLRPYVTAEQRRELFGWLHENA